MEGLIIRLAVLRDLRSWAGERPEGGVSLGCDSAALEMPIQRLDSC